MKNWLYTAKATGAAIIFLAAAQSAFAQTATTATRSQNWVVSIVSTLVFGFLGIFMTIIGFKIFDAVVHFDLEREVCEKQNFAVAIVSAAIILGISIIIAATVVS